MKNKKCWRCTETKPIECFYTNEAMRGGIDAVCKDCNKELARLRYHANKQKSREKAQDYYTKNKELVKERQKQRSQKYGKKWYADNREKHLARAYLHYYVKKGTVRKPTKCEDCLQEVRVEGHHPDYTKPLQVNWLCRKCHESRHHD